MGEVYPPEKKKEILSKTVGTLQIAGDLLQWNIVKGIEENTSETVSIINMIPVNSYPRWYRDWRIKTSYFSHGNDGVDVNVGYINITIIKQLLRNIGIIPNLIKIIEKKNNEKKTVLFAYTLNNGFLQACKYAKLHYPKTITCAIVADLPKYSNLSSNKTKIKHLYEIFQNVKCKKLLKYIDCYVLLTDAMHDALGVGNKPYCIIEGIVANSLASRTKEKVVHEINTIVYTGTLHKCFGIMNLVNAFRMIEDSSFILIICGVGDADKEISIAASEDPRIKFFGQLDYEKVLNIQRSATVLVNPRQNNEEFTKYSFPSKIMEYMISGAPIIGYKLDGMPDIYDQYIIYPRDNSIKALSETLIDVCKMSNEERNRIGYRNQKFIFEKKNEKIQSAKIISMIDNSF